MQSRLPHVKLSASQTPFDILLGLLPSRLACFISENGPRGRQGGIIGAAERR